MLKLWKRCVLPLVCDYESTLIFVFQKLIGCVQEILDSVEMLSVGWREHQVVIDHLQRSKNLSIRFVVVILKTLPKTKSNSCAISLPSIHIRSFKRCFNVDIYITLWRYNDVVSKLKRRSCASRLYYYNCLCQGAIVGSNTYSESQNSLLRDLFINF